MLSLALIVAAASLGTLTPKEMVEDEQFWRPCINPYLTLPNVECDQSWPPFWQAKLILPTHQCNCSAAPLHVTRQLTAGMEGSSP